MWKRPRKRRLIGQSIRPLAGRALAAEEPAADPLADIAAAVAYSEDGHARGKIIVDVP